MISQISTLMGLGSYSTGLRVWGAEWFGHWQTRNKIRLHVASKDPKHGSPSSAAERAPRDLNLQVMSTLGPKYITSTGATLDSLDPHRVYDIPCREILYIYIYISLSLSLSKCR